MNNDLLIASSNEFLEKCKIFTETYKAMGEINENLEQENARLSEENARLKSQPAPNPAADEFIRLMGPHMAPLEAKFNETYTTLTETMCELVRAYRKAKEM